MYKSRTILLIAVTFALITPILKPVYAQTQDPCANPTIIGTDNDDVIHGTVGNDIILAKGGDDVIYAGAGG